MKRSRINAIMAQADDMIRSFGFTLPPWAYWSPEEFKARKTEAAEVISARNGWDITDYGAGRYDEMGLFLFTLRNGRLADLQRDKDGNFAEDQGGTVWCDGLKRDYAPGEKLRLGPGESVTLMPGDWHAFWGEGGDVLIGEVSTVNDDETDNIFREPIGRFAEIDEDEAPKHLLVSDYRSYLS